MTQYDKYARINLLKNNPGSKLYVVKEKLINGALIHKGVIHKLFAFKPRYQQYVIETLITCSNSEIKKGVSQSEYLRNKAAQFFAEHIKKFPNCGQTVKISIELTEEALRQKTESSIKRKIFLQDNPRSLRLNTKILKKTHGPLSRKDKNKLRKASLKDRKWLKTQNFRHSLKLNKKSTLRGELINNFDNEDFCYDSVTNPQPSTSKHVHVNSQISTNSNVCVKKTPEVNRLIYVCFFEECDFTCNNGIEFETHLTLHVKDLLPVHQCTSECSGICISHFELTELCKDNCHYQCKISLNTDYQLAWSQYYREQIENSFTNIKELEQDQSIGEYSCYLCEKTSDKNKYFGSAAKYADFESLLEHIYTHGGGKSLRCKQCLLAAMTNEDYQNIDYSVTNVELIALNHQKLCHNKFDSYSICKDMSPTVLSDFKKHFIIFGETPFEKEMRTKINKSFYIGVPLELSVSGTMAYNDEEFFINCFGESALQNLDYTPLNLEDLYYELPSSELPETLTTSDQPDAKPNKLESNVTPELVAANILGRCEQTKFNYSLSFVRDFQLFLETELINTLQTTRSHGANYHIVIVKVEEEMFAIVFNLLLRRINFTDALMKQTFRKMCENIDKRLNASDFSGWTILRRKSKWLDKAREEEKDENNRIINERIEKPIGRDVGLYWSIFIEMVIGSKTNYKEVKRIDA